MAEADCSNSSVCSIEETAEPAISWRDEKYRTEDFVGDGQLPRILRFEDSDDSGPLDPGVGLYSNQPVLMWMQTKKRIVRARTVYRDERSDRVPSSGAYFECGETMLIPEDYNGWFEIVPPDFSRAACYRSITEIADIMPKRFFNHHPVKAIVVTDLKDGSQSYQEKKIPPGSVIRCSKVFIARWRTTADTGFWKRKKSDWVTPDVRYLEGVDPDNLKVLIPLECNGKFNVIYEHDRKHESLKSIHRIKDLISDFDLSVMVRLVYGKAPVVPCIFTGLMNLLSFKEESSLVGSTVLNKRNVLFELPMTTSCLISLPWDEEKAKELLSYNSAHRLCQKYAYAYAAMIKLSSDKSTGSDLVEHKAVINAESVEKSQASVQTLDLLKDMNLSTDVNAEEISNTRRSSQASEQELAVLPGDDGFVLESTEKCSQGKVDETPC